MTVPSICTSEGSEIVPYIDKTFWYTCLSLLALPCPGTPIGQLTHVLSEMDRIRGEYGDAGKADFEEGDPKPDIPETLCLFDEFVEMFGRVMPFRLDDECEFGIVGGVVAP